MKYTSKTKNPERVMKITDEMVDAGSTLLARCFAGEDIPIDALLAGVFMAMMSKYDPNVRFTDGEKIFRFDDMKLDG
jgi:hypothetical protein